MVQDLQSKVNSYTVKKFPRLHKSNFITVSTKA